MVDPAPNLDVTHARQGLRGRHALRILAWSLVLGVIVLAGIYVIHFGSHLRGNAEAPPQVARSTVSTQPGVVAQNPATAPQGSVTNQAARPPQTAGG